MRIVQRTRYQRVTNFAFAFVLAISSIAAAGPFVFSQRANALEGDTTGPTIQIKGAAWGNAHTPASVGVGDVFSQASFKLHDSGMLSGVTINGVQKNISSSAWSDVNGVAIGKMGAVYGKNVIAVTDVAGNESTLEFYLDNLGPTITLKGSPATVGGDPYSKVSFALYDDYKVSRAMVNDKEFDLTDNKWSDLNGITSSAMGGKNGLNTVTVWDVLGNSTSTQFTIDGIKPTYTIKSSSVGSGGVYSVVSFKLQDNHKIDKVVLNGIEKQLSDNKYSDLDGVKPGRFGAQEGANTLQIYDVAGNVTEVNFELDQTGPQVTVKDSPDTVGQGPYSKLSLKLFDRNKVAWAQVNDTVIELTDNNWSDLNNIAPGVMGGHLGENTVIVWDALGNSSQLTFSLDNVAPEVEVTTETDSDGNVVVTLTANEPIQSLEGWTQVSPAQFQRVYQESTTEEITVFDLAGNQATLLVQVEREPVDNSGGEGTGNNGGQTGGSGEELEGEDNPDENTVDSPVSAASVVTPLITNPGSAVLGVESETSAVNDEDDADVEGASTVNNPAQAIQDEAATGSLFGLAWYWWLLILAALAAIIGAIVAAARRRSGEA